MTPATQRAIESIEQQLSELNDIRNAAPRDPVFKNWRQATVTVLQRIWQGDSPRTERFRRIPFSPVDPKADVRAVREGYSAGCKEAGRVLRECIEDLKREGVAEGVDATAGEPVSEFEDGYPTVDLPLGDGGSARDPESLVTDLMADMGDPQPQGQDPSSPLPPRLRVGIPSMAERMAQEAATVTDTAATAATAGSPPQIAPPVLPAVAPLVAAVPPTPDATAAPRKGKNMKARLRDLLGFAQLSAKALTGVPREDESGDVKTQAPSVPKPGVPKPVVAQPVVSAPPHVAVPPLGPPATSGATRAEVAAMLDAWRLRASASEPAIAAVPPPPGPRPPATSSAPAAQGVGDAMIDTPSVVMSRPTTLRANIEKVSIDSLISAEFRESGAGVLVEGPAKSREPAVSMNESGAVDTAPASKASSEAAPSVNTPAPVSQPPRPVRPTRMLVRPPMLEDPEFSVDPTPSAELPKPSSQMPVPALSPQATRRGDAAPRAALPPAPAPALPPDAASPMSFDQIDGRLTSESDDPRKDASVDPEAFARATEDFMRSSPVLGASPRRSARPHDDPGFGDADALAVASIVNALADLGVPEARSAETRARLLDLARRLERGDVDWALLRKAVWFAMEYPDLARRLLPVLLPWMDRAA